MPRVAAFLRAINVGGRRVTNAELADLVTAAGYADVSAYQAAGNLLLNTGGQDTTAVEATIEAALMAGLGYAVETFIRTTDELKDLLALRPFDPDELAAAKSAPQIGFLREAPTAEVAATTSALATATDRLAVVGRELHWLPLEGVGRSPLDLTAVADRLGPMTVRTRGTVERIHAKLT